MSSTRSLRQRLLLAAALSMLLVIGVIAPLLYFSFSRALQQTYDQRLESVMLSLIASVEYRADARLSQRKPLLDPAFERPGSGWYWQIRLRQTHSTDALPELRSRSLWDRSWPQQALEASATPVYTYARDFNGNQLRVAEQSIRMGQPAQQFDLLVIGELSALSTAARQFGAVLALALILLIAALCAASALQVRFGLLPLRRVRRELELIRAGEQDQLKDEYPIEIKPLATQINELLERNRAVVQRARQRTGDLAHALKMPLSRIHAEASAPATDSMTQIGAETQRIRQLLDQHLTLAASGAQSSQILVLIAPICDALAQALQRIHGQRAKPVQYLRHGDATLQFRGDAQDLEEMLGNLLDNAWKWTCNRVDVVLARCPGDTPQLQIRISDDGPGLSSAAQVGAMQRGVRFDERTPGSGLGLHIVAQLAADYGGELQLTAAETQGLVAHLRLPGA
jgi:signal transduction histidine kinase